ncbi:hypothetical protein RHSIM_Rhsim08G0169900 [Rhododendron simsii]|uniref:Uncharacterized protein n=1 Tax=Rhododendron simsii TaxID=118357 RepID=A0A834GHP9_RHOSS|nr:hypothetical protein RHSIM_Rhsim08G0169900 [Rhododendron simsii]
MYNRPPTSGNAKYGKLTAGRMVSVPTTEEGGLGDIKYGQERVWALGLPSIPPPPPLFLPSRLLSVRSTILDSLFRLGVGLRSSQPMSIERSVKRVEVASGNPLPTSLSCRKWKLKIEDLVYFGQPTTCVRASQFPKIPSTPFSYKMAALKPCLALALLVTLISFSTTPMSTEAARHLLQNIPSNIPFNMPSFPNIPITQIPLISSLPIPTTLPNMPSIPTTIPTNLPFTIPTTIPTTLPTTIPTAIPTTIPTSVAPPPSD